ncbi:MAG: carboxyl transferase domain-containing protein [Minwuia sp.]|nr:carboxyl transferase domain-containing protein [Minwuia sp.]
MVDRSNDDGNVGTVTSLFRERRENIRTEMGGQDKIDRLHNRGSYTVRERIDRFLDPDSFTEIGTFARSERPEDAKKTPGDGKIGGYGTVDGRTVWVGGDDLTVLRGSSSVVGGKKKSRMLQQAVEHGHPFVFFGETGGARIPDTLGSEGFLKVTPSVDVHRRNRAIPMATAILGNSFGGASFHGAFSDFVVQLRGSCMAVTSPRVVEIATSEKVSFEDLGGVGVHEKITGMIDRTAETEDEAFQMIKDFLSYLPSNAWELPPEHDWPGPAPVDEGIYDLVPMRRTRAYDMRKVLRYLSDDDRIFELKPRFGGSVITALSRLGGKTVGFIASQPMHYAGALTPNSCDKITSFICLCDAFNIPIVFLQDVPGFMVGTKVEHDRLLSRAIMLVEALSICRVPRISLVFRKAFGLAYFAMGGTNMGSEVVATWPSAELSFMDPDVGVNVVHGGRLAEAEDAAAERAALIEQWTEDTDPYDGAGIFGIDEIIDPAETKRWLQSQVRRVRTKPKPWGQPNPLAYWPTCY